MNSKENYPATLTHLYGRASAGVKLGLDAMRGSLAALGHPERRMRHVVVGGTNGKGSTSTLIAAALRASGHRVGHFTSPHLLRFTERIRIDGRELDGDAVVRHYRTVCEHEPTTPRPLSFFEATTALAMLAFAEAEVDVAVLEVGLGGRLDSTNVVSRLLSVVTPIDLDHQQILGDTIGAIAREKAGIIEPGVPVVAAPQHPEAAAVLEEEAAARGSRLLWVARGEDPHAPADWPPYLKRNLATAALACRELDGLGLSCPDTSLWRVAPEARVRGRYERIAGDPLVLVDAGHNPAGLEALLAALDADETLRGKPFHAVFSTLVDRPVEAMAELLGQRAASICSCPVPSHRTLSVSDLERRLPQTTVFDSPGAALDEARRRARTDGGFVLVCGSIYLAGDVVAALTGEPRDPPVDG